MAPTILCVGMAGSGKTTFMQRLNSDLHAAKMPPYVINLDPAVHELPYGANIDIRDTVNYHKVMDDYGLGPNGAITTSLNLFATKIDQVMNIVEKRSDQVKNIIVDTPGQIEVFMWSASGQIITDAFASAGPTMIAYIIDTPRCTSPATFMSNMLYACSILYKTKLPMIIVFNKGDVIEPDFAIEWMNDFEAFQKNLEMDHEDSGYMSSLMNSLALMLDEFYNTLDVCSVSAVAGTGIDEFFKIVDKKVAEFNVEYNAERVRVRKVKEEREAKRKANDLERLLKDVGVEQKDPMDVLSDLEDDDDDDADEDPEDSDGKLQEPGTEESLQNRYQTALKDSQGEREAIQKILSNADLS